MTLYEKILNRTEMISVVGLGYVGLPIAIAFAKKVDVIGFDLNESKIQLYENGIDPTNEVGNDEMVKTTIQFTSEEKKLKEAKFHIVAVPTPINSDKTPDLFPVEEASRIIGRNLTKGSIVVYESTVYPGVTEDICIPILERESSLKCGSDFKIGYSPERINPGDKIHRLENIVKIVSGVDDETLDEIAKVYELIIKAGVHRASSIKVAEAAKVVENSQRDINIAFMNELAMVFNLMGIDTQEVIDAMNTKWNALKFSPGLVGGHCIGVDPYYFVYQAENLGYHSQIITSGRKVNDGMAEYITNALIKKLILAKKNISESKIVIMGITFKENCPDVRNSKVLDIIKSLEEYGVNPIIVDPWVVSNNAQLPYNMQSMDEISDADAIVFAVPHTEFKGLTWEKLDSMYIDPNNKIIVDIKSIFNINDLNSRGFNYWRL